MVSTHQDALNWMASVGRTWQRLCSDFHSEKQVNTKRKQNFISSLKSQSVIRLHWIRTTKTKALSKVDPSTDELRMLWLPWETHRKVWHKMAVWTATCAGWQFKRPFCAMLFFASPRVSQSFAKHVKLVYLTCIISESSPWPQQTVFLLQTCCWDRGRPLVMPKTEEYLHIKTKS